MKQLQLLLGDRRRRQRGSILSGVLIIVAFLSILVGALLTSLTDSFTLTREMADRFTNEATATSAVELAINQLQAGPVPAVCVQDASTRGPWFLTLNGRSAVVTQTCSGILPELVRLITGSFAVDGVHVTIGGQDLFLVADSSGVLSVFNNLGQLVGAPVSIGGPPTAPLLAIGSGISSALLIPAAIGGLGCGGHCVALFNDAGVVPLPVCNMFASTTVTAPPAIESTAGGTPRFPGYAFFGGSGTAGRLYVYNTSAACLLKTSAPLGGGVIGAPLVFPGTATNGVNSTVNDEIFVLVSDGSSTSLQHWQYRETTICDGDCGLFRVGSPLSLTGYIGGSTVGYAISSTVPTLGTNLTLAIAGTSGRMATVRIAVNSGPSYAMSGVVSSIALPGGVSRPPYWCHCPTGDLIGVGGTNGSLYILNTALVVQWSYSGAADGSPPINTTPMADVNGDWYFGASDGAVYDVEIPVSGSQMFRAARVSVGGTITGSPIVAACPGGPCVYLSTSTASYLLRIGTARISELRACVTSGAGSTTCAANPRLWARVEVGPAAILGGSGVFVEGWSFYSP
jgi:hypothetical protein